MRAVQRKHTAPEMRLRRLLHAEGYRYRLHVKTLPGSPDIAFPGRRKAIFVHGCFWHGHDCRAGRPPRSNLDYWEPKLQRNQERDEEYQDRLRRLGWEVLVVWECELKAGDGLPKRVYRFLEGPMGL